MEKIEKIIVWLVEWLSPFQGSYVLVRKSLWQGRFTILEVQSVSLADTAGVKTLGWEIAERGEGRYLAKRVNDDFRIEVSEDIPFMYPKLSSVFIISRGYLIEYITEKKNQVPPGL
ncbi:MAG: hypothetical protein PHZ04_03385 [Patescibacteria group bacterium]|nr:hypothetical protein [Patescibacteria group bacterium]MDD5294709.1 hypothetical protein [Patescibacteria group bacterium]MDD5554215.1 hypothetical protein [Patescibacteria group bacterium]